MGYCDTDPRGIVVVSPLDAIVRGMSELRRRAGGGDMIAIMEQLAKRVDEAQGRAELEARIREVRRRLASDDSAEVAT